MDPRRILLCINGHKRNLYLYMYLTNLVPRYLASYCATFQAAKAATSPSDNGSNLSPPSSVTNPEPQNLLALRSVLPCRAPPFPNSGAPPPVAPCRAAAAPVPAEGCPRPSLRSGRAAERRLNGRPDAPLPTDPRRASAAATTRPPRGNGSGGRFPARRSQFPRPRGRFTAGRGHFRALPRAASDFAPSPAN